MLQLTQLVNSTEPSDATLTLAYDVRNKSRFRANLDDGREAFVQLARGSVLKDGDILAGVGVSVRVRAALELVSIASTSDPLLFARAAYHLGNRHVPLEIAVGRLIYQHDHVLDDMLRELGLEVSSAKLQFQPEGGAYAHGSRHAHHDHAPEP
jgi:urease accessory protein